MCIAIYKPAGAWASKKHLHTSFEANPHGAGFSWHDGTKVQTRKGFFTWTSFWKAYKHYITSDAAAFIHFRITTRGSSNTANCHPYDLGNGVLMHNGPCLNKEHCNGDTKGDRSDSRQFAEDFIAGMTSTQVARIKPMIEAFIGTEKVVMMFDDGKVVLCGEKQGHWAEGCWWSNDSYIDEPYPLWGYTTVKAKPKLAPTTKELAESVWSKFLNQYVKRSVRLDNEDLTWSEDFHAYVPADLSNNACCDDNYVYDDVPTLDGDIKLDIVGEVIHDHNHYLLVLEDAYESSSKQPLAAVN